MSDLETVIADLIRRKYAATARAMRASAFRVGLFLHGAAFPRPHLTFLTSPAFLTAWNADF
jgi:hypothetical protein